jgi:hypothetical protein
VRPRAVTPPCSPAVRVLVLVAASLAVAAAHGPAAASADGPTDTREPTSDLADVGCPDPLVVHHPDGSVGDTAAVAITGQAFERDAAGWASASWQAAPGTTLTAVLATTPTGVQQLPAEPSGTASAVLELAFCGTHDPSAAASDGGPASTARTAPVRFDRPVDAAIDTFPASVFGAAFGLAVGAVVLLLSRSARRDREAKR